MRAEHLTPEMETEQPNSAVEDYFALQPLFTCELQHMAHRE